MVFLLLPLLNLLNSKTTTTQFAIKSCLLSSKRKGLDLNANQQQQQRGSQVILWSLTKEIFHKGRDIQEGQQNLLQKCEQSEQRSSSSSISVENSCTSDRFRLLQLSSVVDRAAACLPLSVTLGADSADTTQQQQQQQWCLRKDSHAKADKERTRWRKRACVCHLGREGEGEQRFAGPTLEQPPPPPSSPHRKATKMLCSALLQSRSRQNDF